MLSIKLTDTLCNMQCVYCYEHICRLRGHPKNVKIDMEALRNQIQNEQGRPYLHGGEPLLAPLEFIEELLSMSYQMSGFSSIQTNGTLINKKHIELFKRYNTSIGVSIDGPGELNKYRKTLKGNKSTVNRVMQNIRLLREKDIPVGVISVLTRANALPEQRDAYKKWVVELHDIGVAGRMNPAQIDYPSLQSIALTDKELAEFYTDMAKFCLIELGVDWLPYRDIVDSLLGLNQGTCSFGECDYYNAFSERVIFGDGSTGSCLKTTKTGHTYPRFQNADADQSGFAKVRYELLPLIELEHGGCKGCKYWRNCTGGCPAEGLDGDWRNRTRYCKAYYALFETIAKLLKRLIPNVILTSDLDEEHFPNRNSVRNMHPGAFFYATPNDQFNASSWRKDARVKIEQLSQTQPEKPGMRPQPVNREHGDRPHGDRPHGDSHSRGGR